jgi:hypothetical protein
MGVGNRVESSRAGGVGEALAGALHIRGAVPPCQALRKPSPSRFKESQRPWLMMRWSSSSMSSSCPVAMISTVSATSAAESVGSPDGWLCTATKAVACWSTPSRKTSLFHRKPAAPQRKRRKNGAARQGKRGKTFPDHELAAARKEEADQPWVLSQQDRPTSP